jgi:hypothetical protein
MPVDDEYYDDMLPGNPQLQMPQPRPFTLRHTAPTAMLNANRPITPPRNTGPAQLLPQQQIVGLNTPPRLNSNPNSPFLNAPPMVRAHSSPTVYSPPAFSLAPPRSGSPLRSPKRVRSPLRHASADDIYNFGSGTSSMSPEIGSISEDAELEITPRSRQHPHNLGIPSGVSPYASLTFPRPLRRRPHSPLRSLSSSRASSVPASPQPPSGRFNEAFPSDLPYSRSSVSLSSSMPSTPTSARSRSPSISSLETIPDTPDAERRAVEQDRMDREERKRMWDLYGAPSQSSSTISSGNGGPRGGTFGSRDKRKRWSVCGAEKRSDLNLETIWED